MQDNVWLRARKAFSRLPGVVGVGYGAKLTSGRRTAQRAIIVFVERKLPRDKVRADELIPAMFEGHPTDVRVPQLTPDPKQPRECLTDYQWIDWAKLDQMWAEQRRRKS